MPSPEQLDKILGQGTSDRISTLGVTEAFDTFEHFSPQTTFEAKLAGVAVLSYIKGYTQRVKEEVCTPQKN